MSDEIRAVERAILFCELWTSTKARDFEDERAISPFEFDYQSLHYIVRAKKKIRYNEIDITEGIPCEIQIRTLLQHAYSELTHDTIYKPNVQAEPGVKRSAAKSMALIEATDDYFTQVHQKLALALAPGQQVAAVVDRAYTKFLNLDPEPSPLNALLVDHFKQWAREGFDVDLNTFLQDKPFVADFIRERAPTNLLYRQPAVLLVYWAVSQGHERRRAFDGPLSDDELAPFYGDFRLRLPERRI